MNGLHARFLAGAVLVGVTLAGCSTNDEASESSSATAAVTSIPLAIDWTVALEAAGQFDMAIADLGGDRLDTVWIDLEARLQAVASVVGVGPPSESARADWVAFLADERALGATIDADAAQLGAKVVSAWDRFDDAVASISAQI